MWLFFYKLSLSRAVLRNFLPISYFKLSLVGCLHSKFNHKLFSIIRSLQKQTWYGRWLHLWRQYHRFKQLERRRGVHRRQHSHRWTSQQSSHTRGYHRCVATPRCEPRPMDTGRSRQPDLRDMRTHTGASGSYEPMGDQVQSSVQRDIDVIPTCCEWWLRSVPGENNCSYVSRFLPTHTDVWKALKTR